ncbi:MAG: arginine--tRNA ligase, partial [Planctomycetes bacterium]|nr:arginine--tRNA ligase [Planctomycetota bacterium]
MKSMEQALAEELARSLPLSEDELLSLLEAPPSQDMGDYALPCFTLAGRMRKAPDVIARELLEQLTPPEGVQDVKAEGPYLNFFLERAGAAQRVLCGIRALGEQYGAADLGAGKTVVIEFSSPNIAKHLGIHHLPSAAIGMSLCRLHRKLGYDVVGLNFLGDWGTGFG